MKKVLSVVSFIAIVILFLFCCHFYTKEMTINDVAEYATAIDNDGEIWAFGPDDLCVGDTVSPILFDNFTSSIYDDVVVNTNVDATALVFVLALLSFCFPVIGLMKEAKAEDNAVENLPSIYHKSVIMFEDFSILDKEDRYIPYDGYVNNECQLFSLTLQAVIKEYCFETNMDSDDKTLPWSFERRSSSGANTPDGSAQEPILKKGGAAMPEPKVTGYGWFIRIPEQGLMEFASDSEAIEYLLEAEDK